MVPSSETAPVTPTDLVSRLDFLLEKGGFTNKNVEAMYKDLLKHVQKAQPLHPSVYNAITALIDIVEAIQHQHREADDPGLHWQALKTAFLYLKMCIYEPCWAVLNDSEIYEFYAPLSSLLQQPMTV